jgi:uncharacterized protein YqgC (DUF456 family)
LVGLFVGDFVGPFVGDFVGASVALLHTPQDSLQSPTVSRSQKISSKRMLKSHQLSVPRLTQANLDGLFVGDLLDLLGLFVGDLLGLFVGDLVGLFVGDLLGLFVGDLVHTPHASLHLPSVKSNSQKP